MKTVTSIFVLQTNLNPTTAASLNAKSQSISLKAVFILSSIGQPLLKLMCGIWELNVKQQYFFLVFGDMLSPL